MADADALIAWLEYVMGREERAIALREMSNDLLDVLLGKNDMLLPVFFCGCCHYNKCYTTEAGNVGFVLRLLKSFNQEELDTIIAQRGGKWQTTMGEEFDCWEVRIKPKGCLHRRMCDVALAMSRDGPVPPVRVFKAYKLNKGMLGLKKETAARRDRYNLRPRRRQQ